MISFLEEFVSPLLCPLGRIKEVVATLLLDGLVLRLGLEGHMDIAACGFEVQRLGEGSETLGLD